MRAIDSYLYKLLRFWQRFENGFNNVNEIYFFIYGYNSFMRQENVPKELFEDWIYDFFAFLSNRLRQMFYPLEEERNIHFGMVINEYINDDKKGVDLFYTLLDEFIAQKS